MHRFFVQPEAVGDGTATLPEETVRQVRNVLRLKPGDGVVLFDGSGREWTGVLDTLGRREAAVTLMEESRPQREAHIKISLLVGLVRPERFEFVLQKGTELGAHSFVPLITERVQGRDESRISSSRLDRWRRIITEAAEQSGRVIVPELGEPSPLLDAIKRSLDDGPVLLLWEEEKKRSLSAALRALVSDAQVTHLAIATGPVGGFSAEEVSAAEAAGAPAAGMGPRVLRTETAAISGLVAALYEIGDLG